MIHEIAKNRLKKSLPSMPILAVNEALSPQTEMKAWNKQAENLNQLFSILPPRIIAIAKTTTKANR